MLSSAYSMDTQRIADKAKNDFIGFIIVENLQTFK